MEPPEHHITDSTRRDASECNHFNAANPNYLEDSFRNCMDRRANNRAGS